MRDSQSAEGRPGRAVTDGPAPAAAPPHAGLVLATVCLCQAMVVLDISVVNVALPSIATDLGFSQGSLSWVVNAYTLVFGGLLLLGGRIADLIGHRRAMLAGLGLFALASVLGGLAQSPGELIAARAGQGLAGAVLAPVSLTVIMVTFPEGPVRNRAVGIWAMVAAGGSALGVLLGGLLTDLLDWRWVLFVNVPIVAVTAPLAWRSIHETRALARRRLDVPGAILGTAGITLLVYAMVQAGDHSWTSTGTVVGLVGAAVLGAAFVAWEQWGTREPLVRLNIFTVRTVWVANAVVVFIGAATVAGFYFASLFLQDVLHYSPIKAGAAFLPFCFGIVVGARFSSTIAARFGNRVTISGGLVLGAVGMLLFSRLHADSTFLSGFLLPSVLASIGIGACMVSNTTMGTSGVAHHEAGLVSGLLNTSRQCGGSIGLAALSTVAVSAADGAGHGGSLQAIVHGYDRAFQVTALLVLAAAVLAALFTPVGRTRAADAVNAVGKSS
ncbi:drug resistance transporter, EmrB/QacA subfamily [Actinacidiphila alni]|uniref:Drug resistance transporter, EmrB/QacA subfamily n=1 Tax=Actinacidiphila alni TaxID=380248 RepID=A0A1I2ARS9_9ACTN|nr:MFS transporter [Actinacidiphila alni]SFE45713.1 drug resistance transporter, EmrB/QacA subfamily [Actinacidiphila alni]